MGTTRAGGGLGRVRALKAPWLTAFEVVRLQRLARPLRFILWLAAGAWGPTLWGCHGDLAAVGGGICC
jgi:hypothetical protein